MKYSSFAVLVGICVLATACGEDSNPPAGEIPLTCADVDRTAAGEAPPMDEAEITLSGTYRIDGRWVLDSDEDVTIEPGTVFIMGPSADVLIGWRSDPATVFGNGTAEAPILFCGEQEGAGFWTGLQFLTGVQTDTYLEHVRIEDAGKDDEPALRVSTEIRLQDVTVTGNGAVGFELQSLAEGSSNLTSTANGSPAQLGGESAVTNFPEGEYTGNETDVIEVEGYDDTNVVFHDRGVPYLQTRERVIFGPASGEQTSITFEAGVEYRFCQDCFMNIGWRSDPGAIYVNGTEDNPAIFTSSQDDPQPGDWNGLFLLTGTKSDSVIEHAEFRYGGKADEANLVVDGGNGTVTNSLFADSAGAGLLVKSPGDGLTIGDNTFESNAAGDLVEPN